MAREAGMPWLRRRGGVGFRGRNHCVRNLGGGRGSRPDRSAGPRGGGGAEYPRVCGAMAAVPGILGIQGLQGIQTCLRVAGAAAARPECFLRYRGAAGEGMGSPREKPGGDYPGVKVEE